MRVVAIICTRNEELHIARCLDDLHAAGIETILIDNDSTDRTVLIAQNYLGKGLLFIKTLPWRGHFSLAEQIATKKEVIGRIEHDWVLYVDADEWLCPLQLGSTLADAINRVDSKGFNCINFDEMVFAPWPGEDFTAGGSYTRRMLTYYFFEPRPHRLMRAWRRDLRPAMETGHRLFSSQLKLYPHNFVLRHYVALSRAHAIKKYVGRRFDPTEVARGWHFNRLTINADNLMLKPSSYLKRLERWDSTAFDKSAPATKHFWEW
jgi:glycosyltransferase involved in cell wall biosynthesis